ncbi:chondroitin N-acetylgalactosaminyltransferase [Necator americanus]|uniref:Hexosyltransferase n=1 Tax=Necator americanus TaxID=51031 RepID=W2T4V4_NECAM|nr:chondroitin N-acetylgalactosaminyltransferase [Necator americanus]ETN76614.1 chondroitin N-acetylgalactosaminyltransferase [Necator americanus]
MVAGSRTCIPLLGGMMLGALLAMLLFSPDDTATIGDAACPPQSAPQKQFVDVSEHWTVHLDNMPSPPPNQDATPKVVRARFAATELGIRERLMVGVLAESSLAVAMNASLGRHVPRIHVFADASRIDTDLAQLTNLSPYKPNGQKSHVFVLGLIFNLTFHENFDWFLLVRDSTYINPFELNRFINSVNWNQPVLIGQPADDGSGRCMMEAGVILSNPAMQKLIQQRHACNLLASGSDADQLAFEKCLQLATNLSCISEYQGQPYKVWRVDGTQTAHDAIDKWRDHESFNKSIAVTKLLSDADASALHDHFVSVEVARVDDEIAAMEVELAELQKDTDEGPTWPAAVPAYSKPPNRYQVGFLVPTWEFFTLKDIFRSEPNQNVRPLEGKDRDDVMEVVAAARQHAESEEPDLEFIQVRNGYRLFDPQRGMDYMVDLVYKDGATQATVERRVHLCRMVAGTQLMNQVPYVKEDTDMTIVVPVSDESEVLPARRLLARHARLCTAPAEETRKTRVVVALLPGIDPRSATNIGNDLEELKRRCKRSGLESDLLQLQGSSAEKTHDGTSGDVGGGSAALDEAIDRYGSGSIFLLLSPYADVQKEFLDRARINTIKHYQAFFPIPFVEYHPTISGMDVEEHEVPADQKEAREAALARLRDSSPPKRKRPLIVQKDHGRFDSLDFSCMAVYGSDYVTMRPKLSGKRLDLIGAFLNQDEVHVLRAVEPTLRLRYHQKTCDSDLVEEDYSRCMASKRENVAAKDQLARLLFHEE